MLDPDWPRHAANALIVGSVVGIAAGGLAEWVTDDHRIAIAVGMSIATALATGLADGPAAADANPAREDDAPPTDDEQPSG